MTKVVQTNKALTQSRFGTKGGGGSNANVRRLTYTFDTTLLDLHVVDEHKGTARISRPRLNLIADRKTGRVIFGDVAPEGLFSLSRRTRKAALLNTLRRSKKGTPHGQA